MFFMRVTELEKGKRSTLYGGFSEYVLESSSVGYAKRSFMGTEQSLLFAHFYCTDSATVTFVFNDVKTNALVSHKTPYT